ncbi:hypothetical protein Acr_01g0005900 [Actinidia rufa]|uniref:CCHC-type domain-containing protein n=1 Tax=Actinidia rufa TaxID=165716 RepID=A0A7J0E2Q9_9ERIC|nr:hypothetical protein Acr_01g0005900 [Actinidia rufa]
MIVFADNATLASSFARKSSSSFYLALKVSQKSTSVRVRLGDTLNLPRHHDFCCLFDSQPQCSIQLVFPSYHLERQLGNSACPNLPRADVASQLSSDAGTPLSLLYSYSPVAVLALNSTKAGYSSRRYGAPAPNRVGNGVQLRPHAPFEDRRVRSVSDTHPGRSHALPRARGRTHAPARAKERLPRAEKGAHALPRAEVSQPRAVTRGHALGRALPRAHVREGSHAPSRLLVVRHETSAYDLWIKLEEMLPGEDISEQSLIDEEACEFEASEGDYSGGTYERVPEFAIRRRMEKLTTSMVMDALFNEEARRREMGSTDQSESQALARGCTVRCFYCDQEGHIKRDCPKYKAYDQSSDIAVTTVMADEDEIDVLLAASDNGKSDWVLDSGSAYHLCRDREVFSTYAACEGRIWMANNTSSRVVGRGSVRFCMTDGRDVALRLVEEFSEFPRKTRKCCGKRRLEGYTDWRENIQTGRATVRHGSSSISEKNGKGKQPLHKGTQSKRRGTWGIRNGTWRIRSSTRAQGDALGYVQKSGRTRVMQPVQDVHREAQKKETKSILRSCTAKGAVMPKRVSFALDLISGGVLSSCAHKGGEMEPRQLAKSEVVRKDNLKTSDYPPVGWRGRLLSPAHLDESKPTWMSPSPVAKPKPDWSSYGVSM